MLSITEIQNKRLDHTTERVINNMETMNLLKTQTNKLLTDVQSVTRDSQALLLLQKSHVRLSYSAFEAQYHLAALSMIKQNARMHIAAL